MTLLYNNYQNLLLSYNFSDKAGQTLLDDTSTTADDTHIKVQLTSEKYTFYYKIFTSVSDMASTGYYDVPGNDLGTSGVYDSFYNNLATQSSVKNPSLTSDQISLVNSVLNTSAYSVLFEDVANIDFQSGTNSNAHITFGQISDTHPFINGDNDNKIAGTVNYNPANSENTKERNGDIWLNQTATNYWTDLDKGGASYYAIIHEVGHALGLAHTDEYPSIDSTQYSVMSYHPMSGMNPTGANNEVMPSGLQILDIAALQEIYGRNYDTRDADTTYSDTTAFVSTRLNDAFIYTIWDGGGDDTVDASAYTNSTGAIIDLRQGEFSSIGYNAEGGAAIDNVAIAYYAVIENAIGTDHADILIGNAWDNTITGGDGADHIFGDGLTVSEDSVVSMIKGAGAGFSVADDARPGLEAAIDGSGNDILLGGDGDDIIYGGAGIDLLEGQGDNDELHGGDGDDTLDGGDGVDEIYADNGKDLIFGHGSGSGLDGDVIDGGLNTDILNYAQAALGSSVGVSVNLTSLTGSAQALSSGTAFGDEDQIVSIEKVFGTDYADKFTAFGRNVEFAGGQGGDTYNVYSTSSGMSRMKIVEQSGASGTDNILLQGVTTSNSTGEEFASGVKITFGSHSYYVYKTIEQVNGVNLADYIDEDEKAEEEPAPSSDSRAGSSADHPFDPNSDIFPLGPVRERSTVPPHSPLVLDLNDDGVQLSALYDTETYFDLKGHGQAVLTGWVSPEDGLLARDINSNGTIDNISELFGNSDEIEDGFSALRILDSNHDSKVDSSDDEWDSLSVWIDENVDGETQSDELHTLTSLNIVSISLDANLTPGNEISGNEITHTSTYTTSDDEQHDIVDAWFNFDSAFTQNATAYDYDVRAFGLPDLRGFGDLKDIHVAASLDNLGDGSVMDELLLLSDQFAGQGTPFDTFENWGAIEDTVDALLLRWAGVDQYTEDRGDFVDPKHIAFYEAITGQSFTQYGFSSPGVEAGAWIEQMYDYIKTFYTVQLVGQFIGKDIFDSEPTYDMGTGKLEGSFGLSSGVIDAIETAALASDDPAEVWARFAQFIGYTQGLDNLSSGEITLLDAAVFDTDEPGLTEWSDVVSLMQATLGDIITSGEDFISTELLYDNSISGTSGDDTLNASNSYISNELRGLSGNDTLNGVSGTDKLDGGDGNDILIGNGGDDYYLGGSGNDTYVYESGKVTLLDSAGTDEIQVSSSTGLTSADVVSIYRFDDSLIIQLPDNNRLTIADYFSTSDSIEKIKFLQDNSVVTFADLTTLPTFGSDSNHHLVGSDTVDDTIHGHKGNDRIEGLGGNDTLYGGSGSDYIKGGSGDDILDGGAGDDELEGESSSEDPGNDTYIASSGHDVIYDRGGDDHIVFDNGILASDLTYSIVHYGYDVYSLNNLKIEWSGNSIVVVSEFDDVSAVETLAFADSSTVDLSTIQFTIYGFDTPFVVDSDHIVTDEVIHGITTTGFIHDDIIYARGGDDTVLGLDGDDVIYGGVGNDTIYGYTDGNVEIGGIIVWDYNEGVDRLYGGDGNDTLIGASGWDILDGGAGDDILYGGGDTYESGDTYYASTGNDQIIDTGGDYNVLVMPDGIHLYNVIFTTVGDDLSISWDGNTTTIFGQFGTPNVQTIHFEDGLDLDISEGISFILGTPGSDTLMGGVSDDILMGFEDDDTIDGDDGNNTVSYAVDPAGVTVNLLAGIATGGWGDTDTLLNIQNVKGSSYADIITGDGNDNVLEGLAGDDVFNDSEGSDILSGGNGLDTASYSNQSAGIFADLSFGAVWKDASTDSLDGVENIAGSDYDDVIWGDDNNNVLDGAGGNDFISGGEGDNTLHGGAGFDFIGAGTGNNIIDGGADEDTIDYSSSTSSVIIDLSLGSATHDSTGVDAISNIEDIIGSSYGDTITGDDNNNLIIVGAGDNIIDGGDGTDSLDYLNSSTQIFANLALGTISHDDDRVDIVSNVENVYGSEYNDLLVGSDGDNILIGADGVDTLFGGAGNDTLDGGDGDDTASYDDAASAVTVNLATGTATGEGNDTLIDIESVSGSAYNDTIIGNSSSNVFFGNSGDDAVTGAGGDDQYLYITGDGTDTLSDSSGTDEIVLSSDIHSGDLAYSQDGNDLLISVNGGSSTAMRVVNHFTTSAIETLRLSYDDSVVDLTSLTLPINGTSGNDTINGTSGADEIHANAGNDIVNAGGGADLIYGDAGNDTIYGEAGADTINGGDNNDTLDGGADNDTLNGNDGDDTLIGGTGDDALDGGNGNDTASYSGAASAVTVSLAAGTATGQGSDTLANIEHVTGSAYNDIITGSSSANILAGLAGNDTISGGGGSDTIYGDAGDDSITFGSTGTVALYGGADSDVYIDQWTSGNTSRSITISDSSGTADTLILGISSASSSMVTASISGYDLNIVINDGAGHVENITIQNHFLVQEDGNDFSQSIESIKYSDNVALSLSSIIKTGTSSSLTGGSLGEILRASSGNNTVTGNDGDDIALGAQGNDSVRGNNGNDILYGGDGDDTLDGGAGTDTVYGNAGNDVLDGYTGDDHLYGDAGDDILQGGAGNDVMDGGGGVNTVSYSTATGSVTVSLATGTASNDGYSNTDTFINITNATGSNQVDTITGDSNANVLSGGGGNDTINGGDGNDTLVGNEGYDTLNGGAGEDTVSYAYIANQGGNINFTTGVGGFYDGNDTFVSIENAFGSTFADSITGNTIANVLNGWNGSDTIKALEGDDTLIGGNGNDILEGGKGSDTVDYGTSTSGITANLSTTTIFDGLAGTDTISSIENVNGSGFVDTITGNSYANIINAAAGNDIITGGGGNDTLIGGSGNDKYYYNTGDNYDVLTDTSGSDEIVVSSDVHFGDVVLFRINDDLLISLDGGVSSAMRVVNHFTTSAIESLRLSYDNSVIDLTTASITSNDTPVSGTSGDDEIHAGAGNDTVMGNAGSDLIYGGTGDDVLFNDGYTTSFEASSSISNSLYGEDGNDSLYAVSGTNDLYGGNGNDFIYVSSNSSSATNSVYGDAGDDKITFNGIGTLIADGGVGNDVYVDLWQGGDSSRNVTISDAGGTNDILKLNITSASASMVSSYITGGTDLHIVIDYGTGHVENITIQNQYAVSSDGNTVARAIDEFSYSDGAGVILIPDQLSGTTGDDLLVGVQWNGSSMSSGLHGNDYIYGGDGNDGLDGYIGDDHLFGNAGDDILQGGAGNDVMDGGAGIDTAIYSSSSAAVTVNLSTGTASNDGLGGADTFSNIENITGGNFNDTLTGDSNANIIKGGGGNDAISGGDGDDNLFGNTGINTINGGNGIDTVNYSDLVSTLNVNVDLVNGRTLWGVTDTLISIENVVGGQTNDTILGSAGNNILDGYTGTDTINGDAGDDTLIGGAGLAPDTLNGGIGNDTVDYSSSTAAITVNLSMGTASDGFGSTDTLSNLENVIGSGFNDTITGSSYSNAIFSGSGNDIITAGTGNDILNGGTGNDKYYYNTGDGIDLISDASGSDEIVLSNDIHSVDLVYFRINNDLIISVDGGASSAIRIENHFVVTAVETLRLSYDNSTVSLGSVTISTTGDDVIWGTSGNDTINAGAGNDSINGDAGDDTIYGDAGFDTIYGDAGSDIIYGGSGDDTLYNDGYTTNFESSVSVTNTLYGEDGNDSLYAVSGTNDLYGGNGSDLIFIAANNSSNSNTAYGDDGDDTFSFGDLGTVNLTGGNGNDLYVDLWNGGVSRDVMISDGSGYETLKLGISSASASWVSSYITSGTDLHIVVNNGTGHVETITIQNQYTVSADGNTVTRAVDAFSYSDGVGVSLIADNLKSTSGDDLMVGVQWDGANPTNGGGGNDYIYGGDGNDYITGSTGNDILYGNAGNDILNGGSGTDIVDGGSGIDTVSFAGASAGAAVSLLTNTVSNDGFGNTETLVGFENLMGSSFNDTLIGDAGVNVINGGDGNDTVNGGDGDDILSGGAGTNTINGGNGIDTIDYSVLPSSLNVYVDLVDGRAAWGVTDTLTNIENVMGGLINDTINGNSGANVLNGNSGNDTINGGDGDDRIIGGRDNDSLNGGNGNDTVDYSSSTAGATVNLSTGAASDGLSGTDTLSNFENVMGTAFVDTITGDGNANLLSGLAGNDAISGGNGDDTLMGGLGNDSLNGGGNTDTADYSLSLTAVTANLATGGATGEGTDTFTSIENLAGSALADTLTGDSGNNVLAGGDGNDTITGAAGNDTLNGGNGTDTVSYASTGSGVTVDLVSETATGDGTDTLSSFENVTGSAYADTLTGNSSANVLAGGAGNDNLYGHGGSDILSGGSGADSFMFEEGSTFSNVVSILDFSTTDGDKLDISDILEGYDPMSSAITDFVQITDNGTNTTVSVDADGGGNNFVAIALLANITGLTDENALLTNGNLIAA